MMIAELEYVDKVLDGVQEDENLFPLLYYAEEEHLWDDTGLYQSNPLRIEENYEIIRKNRSKAMIQDELVTEYLTKEMNVFCPSEEGEAYISHEDLVRCRMTEEELENFSWAGREVFSGVDMARTDDNVAYGFVNYDYEEDMFYIDARAFIPLNSVDKKIRREHVDYRQFMRTGKCIACGDKSVSYKVIEDTFLDDVDNMQVRMLGLGFDPFNATHTKNYLEEYGIPTEEIRQYSTHLHVGTKMLKEYILNGKVRYIPNGLLEINFANARVMRDNMDNMYVNKKRSVGKIDIVASIINAMCLWYHRINEERKYDNRGIYFM